jgi:hypothetical protein
MLGSFFQCCNAHNDSGELKVIQLSSDDLEVQLVQPVHLLTRQDSFDVTVTPRTSCRGDRPRSAAPTPRQTKFRDRIQLPLMRRYPVVPTCKPEDSEEWRKQELLTVYQEFVIDLHKGLHMTQLTSNQDYSDIHCQILEDLQTLNVDQGNGCIIEFPLINVSKVYRIVKNDDKWYSAGSLHGPTPMPPLPLSNAEHIVVVEFMRRKLAFVFNEMVPAQNFLMCMELLIRRAQEFRHEADAWKFSNNQKRGNWQMSPVFTKENMRQGAIGNNARTRGQVKLEFAKDPPLCRMGPTVCQADSATTQQ